MNIMQRKTVVPQITEGVIWHQLLIFFFPILLGTFFQQMYNTVDTIIVGQYVGRHALAAVGATAPLINLINGFFIGLSSGATVILSQFYGANDRQGIEHTIHTGMALSLVLGVMVTLIGCLGGPYVLRLIDTPENCIDDALVYTQIYYSGAIASMIYNMGASILRAMGDSKRPMIFLIVTCIVNIIMDLVLVVGLDMGVAGAAIATAASQVVSAILVVRTMFRLPDEQQLHVRRLHIHRNLLTNILQIGVPAGLQFITFDLANVLIQFGINSFGDVTVAAWAAESKIEAIAWMILSALGVAITTFVGQNFGAEKYKRIRRSIWVCMGMGTGILAVICTLLFCFRSTLMGICSPDPDVIRLGCQIMTYTIPYIVFFIPVEILAGAMRGTGYSIIPTTITFVFVCLFRVLWVVVVVSRWHTLVSLAIVYPLSWLLAAIAFFITYFRGTWLRKPIADLGLTPEK